MQLKSVTYITDKENAALLLCSALRNKFQIEEEKRYEFQRTITIKY
jgi:hypothetical protein